MRHAIFDQKYHFFSFFNSLSGGYMRTGIIDSEGKDTGVDPFMASFPHLIDVGIMGHCIHGRSGLCEKAGVACYQNGPYAEEPNMELNDFQWVAEQCRGRTYQFALGGRGDPDQHEHFAEILQICHENQIVPNFTTSGYRLTEELAAVCKKYCGAVAVSWYHNSYTLHAIRLLTDLGVRTNIHFVVSNKTIAEAIARLRSNDFPAGINAVVFLLYKPVGLGTQEDVISEDDTCISDFFEELNYPHPFLIGIDSCSVPGYLKHCSYSSTLLFDTCEGARYSCYIGPDLSMTPCSFDQCGRYRLQLRPATIEELWNDNAFDCFREHLRVACPACSKRGLCMGGCPLMDEIVLCHQKKLLQIDTL